MTTPAPSVEGLKKRALSGAHWFHWIAGLTVVNSIVMATGNDWSFILGLGVSQIVDGLGLAMAERIGIAGKIIALLAAAVPAGIFALFGYFACRGQGWAYWVGAILFGLDTLIFLALQQWVGVAFHIFAILGIVGGARASAQLARPGVAVPPPLPAVALVTTSEPPRA